MSTLLFSRYRPTASIFPPVYVTYSPSKKLWVMVDDYRVDYAGLSFVIPAEFNFDLASVPRWLWPIISSFELSIVAPLIHDYFYRYNGKPVYHLPVRKVTRAQADEIFHDMMILEGIPRWKAEAAYRAVRLFARRW